MFVSLDSNKPKPSRGRVDLSATPPPPFSLFSMDTGERGGSACGAPEGNSTLRGTEASPVSELFFSRDNFAALQHGLRYRVWVETREVISEQPETELLVVMRSIYLQYSRNEAFEVVQQVRELNALVLDYCVRVVVAEVGVNLQYRKDISTLPVPLDRAPLATTKGSRTLEMFKF